jgi:hypothetical protein
MSLYMSSALQEPHPFSFFLNAGILQERGELYVITARPALTDMEGVGRCPNHVAREKFPPVYLQ